MEPTIKPLTQRRLSDFFDAQDRPEALFADPTAVAAAVADGYDPQLYHAVRDVLPSRITAPPSLQHPRPAGGSTLWSADLVLYQNGTLPGGEPFRSTGHWNPADQLEIFQILSGRMLMVSALSGEPDRPSRVWYQECHAGDLAVVPVGAWHLTYILDGPAMVFNIYSAPIGSGEETVPAAHSTTGKYRSQRGPAEITATRAGAGFSLTLSPAWQQACGAPREVSCPAWLRRQLPPSGLLTDLHAAGPDAALETVLATAHAHQGFPDDHHPASPARAGR